MADIRDSTRISRLIGAEKWGDFTKALAAPAEEIANRYGFTLQSIIWDALYFTQTGRGERWKPQAVIEFTQELNGLIYYAAEKCFGAAVYDNKFVRARFCLTFGDITRDIRSSLNNNWTIVGTAMAAISKLEQVCKSAPGWLFIAESVVEKGRPFGWLELDKRVPGTDERIFSFDEPMQLREPNSVCLNSVVQTYNGCALPKAS